MNNKPFDPTKPVQTRSGRPARILTTYSRNPRFPIVALVEDIAGVESARQYSLNGEQNLDVVGNFDLVNVPEKRVIEFWRNIYRSPSLCGDHETREAADCSASPERIACAHIRQEFVVGEGL